MNCHPLPPPLRPPPPPPPLPPSFPAPIFAQIFVWCVPDKVLSSWTWRVVPSGQQHKRQPLPLLRRSACRRIVPRMSLTQPQQHPQQHQHKTQQKIQRKPWSSGQQKGWQLCKRAVLSCPYSTQRLWQPASIFCRRRTLIPAHQWEYS
jgi:hypothetical protein